MIQIYFEKFLLMFFREIAFILADPFVVDMLSRNAMSMLNKCVQNELLPRVIQLETKYKIEFIISFIELYRADFCAKTSFY